MNGADKHATTDVIKFAQPYSALGNLPLALGATTDLADVLLNSDDVR
jgi:hypothetical protein